MKTAIWTLPIDHQLEIFTCTVNEDNLLARKMIRTDLPHWKRKLKYAFLKIQVAKVNRMTSPLFFPL